MFIGGIENSTDQSPKTTKNSEYWQLPNAKIRCFSPRKHEAKYVSKWEEIRVHHIR